MQYCLDALCKEGDSDSAEVLLHHMFRESYLPNVVNFNAVIDGLCKKGSMDKVEKLLSIMLVNGLTPNLITYNCVISGYSELGCWKEAVRVFKELHGQG